MSDCTHDLVDRETACADGLCPLCLRQRVSELELQCVNYQLDGRDCTLRDRLAAADALLREIKASATPIYAKGSSYEVGGYVKDYKVAPHLIHRIDAHLEARS